MRNQYFIKAVCVWFFALHAASAQAHHSFAGQFDADKPVAMTGTIIKVNWTNPHASFLFAVKNSKGVVETWAAEMGSPNVLLRYKWTKDTLKVGDQIRVDGYLARNGSNEMSCKSVKLPDGREISAGSAAGQAYDAQNSAK